MVLGPEGQLKIYILWGKESLSGHPFVDTKLAPHQDAVFRTVDKHLSAGKAIISCHATLRVD